MGKRRSASEVESAAAGRAAPRRVPDLPGGEALAMLVRRGLTPRLARRDLPFPPDLDQASEQRLAEHLRHYAFRLFLRGAILAAGPFDPGAATRYLSAPQARALAEELVALGLGVRAEGGRYRLRWRARNFGGTLEWWVGRELRRRLGFDVATGVRSGAQGVGGDLDVVAAAEGKLVYVELKSSPPKHLMPREVSAFFRRLRSVRPDVAVFAIDTALRLGDKVLPMFIAELGRSPRRLVRDAWCVAPQVYVVNAKQDLVENVRAAIADGLLALGPDMPRGP
jgi:hypothetical protein